MSLNPVQLKEDYTKNPDLQAKYSSLEEYYAAKQNELKNKVAADIQARLSRAEGNLAQKRLEFDLSKEAVFNAKHEKKIITQTYEPQSETSLYAQSVIVRTERNLSDAEISNNVALSSLSMATDSYNRAVRSSMFTA